MQLKTIALATFTSLAALSASGAMAAVTLNLGHTLAPDSHYQATSERMAELAKQKSNGEITINVFPQSQLGGEVKMIQAARSGVQDMLITAQAPLTNTIKEYSLFDIPYLFDSFEQGNKVMSGPVGQTFLDMLPEYKLVGLGFLSLMERNVFSAGPINSKADMEGKKLRVMQSPGYVETYRALGALPTPMAYGDVYLSLQQGVVDGGDTSPDQFVMDKFIEVSKYYNLTKVHYLPALLIISKAKWDKLSPEHQKIIQESATEALAHGRDYYKKSYADSIEQMKAAGVTVVETDLSTLKEASAPVVEALLKDIPNGQALYQQVQQAKEQ